MFETHPAYLHNTYSEKFFASLNRVNQEMWQAYTNVCQKEAVFFAVVAS